MHTQLFAYIVDLLRVLGDTNQRSLSEYLIKVRSQISGINSELHLHIQRIYTTFFLFCRLLWISIIFQGLKGLRTIWWNSFTFNKYSDIKGIKKFRRGRRAWKEREERRDGRGLSLTRNSWDFLCSIIRRIVFANTWLRFDISRVTHDFVYDIHTSVTLCTLFRDGMQPRCVGSSLPIRMILSLGRLKNSIVIDPCIKW